MVRAAFATSIVAFVMFAPLAASAVAGLVPIVPQQGQGSDCNGQGGCQSICDLAILAQNVLDDGIYVAVFFSAVIFAYAGGKMVVASSSGDSAGFAAGKRMAIHIVIGFVILLSAWTVINVFMSVLTNNPNWNQVCYGSTSLAAPVYRIG